MGQPITLPWVTKLLSWKPGYSPSPEAECVLLGLGRDSSLGWKILSGVPATLRSRGAGAGIPFHMGRQETIWPSLQFTEGLEFRIMK